MNRDILSDITVLDIGTAVAGPYAATMLADLGASVIKIEMPGVGDLIRDSDAHVFGMSGYFLGVNRGKRSLTVDLRTKEGQDIISRAAKRSDVLIQNFRPGKMEEWGLGYGELKAQNERLVYCAISMYDETSTLREATGNDIIGQAVSGLMDQTGERDGSPQRIGAPVVDVAAAYLATVAILAALLQRAQTGVGDYVSISLLEAAYSLMPNYTMSILNSEAAFERQGTSNAILAPYRAYVTSDAGLLMVGAFNNNAWLRLCEALSAPELAADERFATNIDRVRHREALDKEIQDVLLTNTVEYWESVLNASDVPATPILSPRRSLEQFQSEIPGLVSHVVGPFGSDVLRLRSPLHAGENEKWRDRESDRIPALGEHTAEILASFDYTPAEIQALDEAGIISKAV